MTSETEKIVVDKGSFKKQNRDRYEKRTGDVDVPELNEFLGLKEEQTAIVIVQQLELSDFLKVRGESFKQVNNLIEGIVSAVSSKKAVKDETMHVLDSIGIEASQMLDIVEIGLVDPKLARDQLIYLEKKFPFTITKMYNKIMELTSMGASLKKNS